MKSRLYLLLLILPLLFIVLGCEKKSNVVNNLNQETQKAEEEELFKTSPDKMIALGKSFHCTFSYEAEKGVTSSGDFYVDGKNRKFRAETMVKDPLSNKDMKSTMIFDNDQMYSWSDNKTYPAIKMQVDTTVGTDLEAANASQAALSDTAEYRCRKWTVDNSKFIPQADIKFTDFQNLMNGFPVK
ncbi:MAG: hypothetical protein UT32_C0011G0034 [Parcubacteria group bacterium GW2011_GWC2_39_14]|nr:MAG: hypothetical protein UT32_C0011G0034 [Parcubacteria group bacterium GW2011_GWC2_39_14]KKR55070.1 MAG: hypothetical protein UT91_C0005G0071 [Parcubacteria group bacterium GW2011_GWA2_40_23]